MAMVAMALVAAKDTRLLANARKSSIVFCYFGQPMILML